METKNIYFIQFYMDIIHIISTWLEGKKHTFWSWKSAISSDEIVGQAGHYGLHLNITRLYDVDVQTIMFWSNHHFFSSSVMYLSYL